MKRMLQARFMLVLALLLALGILLALGGCARVAGDLMAEVKAAEKPANPAEPDETFISSVSSFSWTLSRSQR